jgi:hypothetical protein
MCNVLLVAIIILVPDQRDFQLRILLLELLSILSTALVLAMGINLALSARLRACSQRLVLESLLQGRWTGRGIVLAGVKVAGPAPTALPSLPLLLAWLAAAWLGRAHAGVHWNAVIASFTVVWFFLIDADGPLRNGDPDDHLRIVVLFHSKVWLLPLTAALAWLCVPIFGPSDYTLLAGVVLYMSLHVRKHVLHSWPGPPPAEVERQRPLPAEVELQRLELGLLYLERLHLQRELEIARREQLERQRLIDALEAERLELQRLHDALQPEYERLRDQHEKAATLSDALKNLLEVLWLGVKCYVMEWEYRTFKRFRDFARFWHSLRL